MKVSRCALVMAAMVLSTPGLGQSGGEEEIVGEEGAGGERDDGATGPAGAWCPTVRLGHGDEEVDKEEEHGVLDVMLANWNSFCN